MSGRGISILWCALLPFAVGCRLPVHAPPVTIPYVGSSTVAVFLEEADLVYAPVSFTLDTAPESEGGERAILAGSTPFAGIARKPRPETLAAGIVSTLIGRDAIAVIVHRNNPVANLTRSQLRDIFTGKVHNWEELGGPNQVMQPFIVGEESATHRVFREVVLEGQAYEGCEAVRPDEAIVSAVANHPGGIGQISFSFLNGSAGVHTVAVDAETPAASNFDYRITRPLYLLWREGNPEIEAFVEWCLSKLGQRVVQNHFVGLRVVGAAEPEPEKARTGTLVVYTYTFPVYDGGIYYYPHRPYEILTRHGEPIRRVRNHRGDNDETATRVRLEAGLYLIRTVTLGDERFEFFARVEAGRTAEIDVDELLESRR